MSMPKKDQVRDVNAKIIPSWGPKAIQIRKHEEPGYILDRSTQSFNPNNHISMAGKDSFDRHEPRIAARLQRPMTIANLPKGPPLPEKRSFMSNVFGKKKSAKIAVLGGKRKTRRKHHKKARRKGKKGKKGSRKHKRHTRKR